MDAYLTYVGVDVWSTVLVIYDVLDVPPTHANSKNIYGNNAKDKSVILFGLSQFDLVKFMHCKSAKEVWVKLNYCQQGDDKVK